MLLSPEEMPSDLLLKRSVLFDTVMLTITFIIFAVTITVMLRTRTQSMKTYRYYLINELFWSVLFDVMGNVVCPVTLFPVPCYFGAGIVIPLDQSSMKMMLYIGAFILVGRGSSLFFQFAYRFVQSIPPSSMFRCKGRVVFGPHEVVGLFLFFLVLHCIIIIVPLYLFFPNQDKQRELLINSDPYFNDLYQKYPNILCFSRGTELGHGTYSLIYTIFLLIGFVIVAITVMHRCIRTSNFSTNTQRMQLMLFWGLVAQFCVALVTLAIPGIFYFVAPFFGVRNLPRLLVYCTFPVLTQTILDCFMILYFIKPYRTYVKKAYMKMSGNSVTEVASIYMTTTTPSRRMTIH